MKKLFIVLFAALASSTAFAQSSQSQSESQSQTQQSQSAATNAGNAQSITVNIPASIQKDATTLNINSKSEVSGTQTVRNVPSVSGSALTSSNDTCMGSASGSINVPGFGIGLGKTYTDSNCVMLKNSRELWNMGMRAAALALMCKDGDNREALEVTGFVCPPIKSQQSQQSTSPDTKSIYQGSVEPDMHLGLQMSTTLSDMPVQLASR